MGEADASARPLNSLPLSLVMLLRTLAKLLPYFRRRASNPAATPAFVLPEISMIWRRRTIHSSKVSSTSPAVSCPTTVSISHCPKS